MRGGNSTRSEAAERDDAAPTRVRHSPRSTAGPRSTPGLPVTDKVPAVRRTVAGKRKATAAPSTDPQLTLPTKIVSAVPANTVAVGEDIDAARETTLVLPETHRARRRTTARPIRPEDTALVESTTLILRVVDAVPADIRALTSTAGPERTPVTIIPRTAELPAIPAPAPVMKPRRRTVHSTALVWTLASALVVSVLSAATPLAVRFIPQTVQPRAARMAVDPRAVPSDPWASMSGAVDVLGIGGGAGPGVTAPGSAGLPVKTPPKQTSSSNSPSNGISRPPVSPWPPTNPYMYVPGHPAFTVQPNGFYSWAFGQCTWWAQWMRRDENLTHMGNAMYWAASAARRGYRVGTVPVAGATVVFQPGVQGAGGAGHVAHVVAVYPGGWFLVSEMNYYWNGGGWGRVDYRFAHAGWGVQFIY